ncbi:MAG: hypothetical protein ACYTGG_00245 [Planctomycetota bacterium]|jgi:hypothetical protein
MQQGTYLNVILTINAILLAALVWVSLGPAEADAQQVRPNPEPSSPVRSSPFTGTPFPINPGAQRIRMIELLEHISAATLETNDQLEAGEARVQVTNLSEIQGN